MTVTRQLTLRAAADTAAITTKQYKGIDYLVVPVVALKGGIVIRPMGSLGPELVPAEVLSNGLITWNNKPVLLDHPSSDGLPLSGNELTVLENTSFGFTMGARIENNDLKFDIWLSQSQANNVEFAADAIERMLAGADVETSVGALIRIEERIGVAASGKDFEYAWTSAIGDHFAVLKADQTGACSVADGCGAPRLATAIPTAITTTVSTSTPLQLRVAEESSVNNKQRQAIIAAREALRAATLNGELSDQEFRGQLWKALDAAIPGFDWLNAYYADQQVVEFETWLDGTFAIFQAPYVVASDDTITIGDPVEGTFSRTFQPKIVVDADASSSTDDNDSGIAAAKGDDEMTEKELAARAAKKSGLVDTIIACECCPWTADDKGLLDVLSLAQLESISSEANIDDAEPVPAAASATEPVAAPAIVAQPVIDPDVVQLSSTDYAQMKAASDAHEVHVTQLRAATIARISTVNPALTEAFLSGQSDEQLAVLTTSVNAQAPTQYIGPVANTDPRTPRPPLRALTTNLGLDKVAN